VKQDIGVKVKISPLSRAYNIYYGGMKSLPYQVHYLLRASL